MRGAPGGLAALAIFAMLAIGSRSARSRPPSGGGGRTVPPPVPPPPPPPPAGGTVLSLAQLRQLAVQTGFAQPDVAAAVAMAESAGHVDAVGDVTLGGSYGLWQIHHPSHPEYDTARLASEPAYNASAALQISSGGTNWAPWTTYKTGAYLAYMPGGAPA